MTRVLVAPGRRGGGRGARLPAGPRRVRVATARRWCRSGSTSRGWSSTSCPPTPGWCSRRRRTSSPRPAALAGPAPGAARLRRPAPVRGDRGRLRQRVPLHRAAPGDPALDGRRGPGALPRHVLQVAGARACGSATWWRPSRSRTRCAPRSSSSVGYVDVPEQAALARFLEDGLFARHLRRARAAYAERRALVLEAIHGPLAGHLELVPARPGCTSPRCCATVRRRHRGGRGGPPTHGLAVEALVVVHRGR